MLPFAVFLLICTAGRQVRHPNAARKKQSAAPKSVCGGGANLQALGEAGHILRDAGVVIARRAEAGRDVHGQPALRHPERKVGTPAHTKPLGWYLVVEFRVTHRLHGCPGGRAVLMDVVAGQVDAGLHEAVQVWCDHLGPGGGQ